MLFVHIKLPHFEASKNVMFQYTENLGVCFTPYGYGHHSDKIPVEKIWHDNEDSDVRCAKIYFAFLTVHH